jgi:glucose/arabinose dehydrogenase
MVPLLVRVLAGLTVLAMAASASGQLRATLVASGFSRPVGFIQDPSDSTVQVVLEQAGRVRVLKNGVLQNEAFLDLTNQIASAGEQGLLGLAFSPDYTTSGRVYVNFTNLAGDSVIARFRRSASNPLRADPASRFDLRWPGGLAVIAQPFTNHNGGNMAFGPDGYLYVGFGDGGSANDPFNLAQNPQSLLGKMLRIDVSVGDADPEGYDVPGANPFVGRTDVRPEIWALGLRNPWRWSFDDVSRGGTGALLIGDVGQGAWEEIDYEPRGAGGRNYGWRNREGAHNNVTTLPPFSTPLRDPIWEYSRTSGGSVTGGYVYRGRLLGSAYLGRYFFGDFISSRVWSLALRIDPATGEATTESIVEHTPELASAAMSPSSFGVDASGELYLVSYLGAIYRLENTQPVPEPGPDPAPVGARRGDGPVIGHAAPRPR